MTEELPFGPQLFKDEGLIAYLNAYLKHFSIGRRSYKGDCESQSLTLARYLLSFDKPVFVAQIALRHTVVLFNNEFWIDPLVGVIWDIKFNNYIKLQTFDELYFDTHWSEEKRQSDRNGKIIFLQLQEVNIKNVLGDQ